MAQMAGVSPTNINFQETLKSAVRHAAQLSERNRLLINAFYASGQGDFIKAQELYRNIVSQYPDEVEAWVALGTIQMNSAGRMGRSLQEARTSLERAVYYDPDNLPAVPFLWIISIWEGSQARSDSLAERLMTLVPTSEKTIQTRAWLAFSQGDAAAQEQVIEQARGANSFEVWLTSTFLCRMPTIHRIPQQFSNTVRFVRLLTEPTRSADDRYAGHRVLTHLQLTRGFWRAAREELERAESVKPTGALEDRALVYLTPLLPVTKTELEDLRKEVIKLNYDPVQTPIFRYYLAGLLSARLGDNSLAQSYVDTLESHANSLMTQEQNKRVGAMAVDYALSVRAHVAWNEGDFQKGLNLLDEGQPEKWWRLGARNLFDSQAYERYMRAELLKSLKRYEEALRWYNTLGYGGYSEFVYSPISHFKQGEVYEELGQQEKAAEHYAKFIEMWKDCDPELRPVVANAERSLERLLQEKAKEPEE